MTEARARLVTVTSKLPAADAFSALVRADGVEPRVTVSKGVADGEAGSEVCTVKLQADVDDTRDVAAAVGIVGIAKGLVERTLVVPPHPGRQVGEGDSLSEGVSHG